MSFFNPEAADSLDVVDNHPKIVMTPGVGQFRRLTPRECERLHGFPDDWTAVGLYCDKHGNLVPRQVSDTQRYKMLGNAVTTKVISAIIDKMTKVWF